MPREICELNCFCSSGLLSWRTLGLERPCLVHSGGQIFWSPDPLSLSLALTRRVLCCLVLFVLHFRINKSEAQLLQFLIQSGISHFHSEKYINRPAV